MKAVYIDGHGGPDCVKLGERPTPEPSPGEVRVALRAASLNRVDLYMRNSGAGITHELPLILGVDGAGVVERCGPEVEGLAVGDRVVIYPGVFCGACEFCRRGEAVLCTALRILGEQRDGTLAEQVVAPARNLVALPDGLDFRSAACLPVAYLTAWRMLVGKAQTRAHHTLLIHGVGGGVSLAALQIARLLGARAIVTSGSDDKLARAAALGAVATINHRDEDVLKRVMALTDGRGVDIVVENVGTDSWPISLRAVVRGGTIVTCGATTGGDANAELQRVFIRQLRILGSTMGDLEEFRQLLAVAADGRLAPVIDRVYPLDEVPAGYARLEAGEQFGKLVVEIG